MKQPASVIEHWITVVNEEGHGLTPWEFDFMESLTEQFEERGSVSEKQQEVLEKIYAEKT